MPRPSNTEARRAQITLGLMKAMAKHGYDGASIGDIAKAAKLATGLVHYHFKDKLEILTALTQYLCDEQVRGLRWYLETRGPSEAVDAVVDYFLGVGATSQPDVLACWVTLSGEALRHKSVQRIVEATLTSVKELLREHLERDQAAGAGAGGPHEVAPDALAAAIIAAVQGYFVVAGTARDLIPRGSAAVTLKAMIHGALRAPPAHSSSARRSP